MEYDQYINTLHYKYNENIHKSSYNIYFVQLIIMLMSQKYVLRLCSTYFIEVTA